MTGVQTCALPISLHVAIPVARRRTLPLPRAALTRHEPASPRHGARRCSPRVRLAPRHRLRDRRVPDQLVVEEPMSIRLDGNLVATTMRTPGHDYELAVGFCHAEGLLAGHVVTGVRYCADGSAVDSNFNVVTVETGGRAPVPTPRLGTTSSSCGLCGSQTLDELTERLQPLDLSVVPRFDRQIVIAVPDSVMSAQGLFNETGAVHAAAVFDVNGKVMIVREDVGRHNAVDKVVGNLLLEKRLPANDLGLFVSGRASFEMVQKAWAAGFGTVV